jgi:hypothetical protein
MKNQLSFNKMIETQLAQLAAAIPVPETGKIPGQPEDVSAISVRRGNSSYVLPPNNHAGKTKHRRRNSWEDAPGIPTIDCKIQNIPVKGALCDLGASVNIMPVTIYERIYWVLPLPPTDIRVQLADSTIRRESCIIFRCGSVNKLSLRTSSYLRGTLTCVSFLGAHS